MSRDDKLCIKLFKREDKNGKTFYVGRMKAPISLDLKDGAAFLVFISEEGCEELQIANHSTKEKLTDIE